MRAKITATAINKGLILYGRLTQKIFFIALYND